MASPRTESAAHDSSVTECVGRPLGEPVSTRTFEESFAAQKSAVGARGNPAVGATLAQGLADGGYRATMRRVAETRAGLNQLWPAAQDYIRAGELDLALDWLERGYELRNQNMPYISVAPVFDPVRDHPRFRALLQRMNLPM